MTRVLLKCLVGFIIWGTCQAIAGDFSQLREEPIRPIPLSHGQDPQIASLGERLFHEVRLSVDDSISCAHCHPLGKGGMDGAARSPGVRSQLGTINTPTVFNAGFNLAQFWDGRADSLESQIKGPIHNPLEMGSNWEQVVAKLRDDPSYAKEFTRLYPDGITPASIQHAIATFERTLITPNGRFDQWLRGDEEALDETEKRGYRLFKGYGCIACHQGVNVGGNMYQLMGAMGDYFQDRRGDVTQADLGRYNVTGDEADRYMFKVPGLRMARRSAPYFHDAGADTLDRAIQAMAKYQLGRKIPREERKAIAAFIATLEGEHPRLEKP